MKPVQVVLDEGLITRIDRRARREGVSRSAFIRSSLEKILRAEQLAELSAKERTAYGRRPATQEEKSATGALAAAQDRVLAQLDEEDRW